MNAHFAHKAGFQLLEPPVAAQGGKIGPNAILQVFAVLEEIGGPMQCNAVAGMAGLGQYLTAPPSTMVNEGEVVRLHRAIRACLPHEAATAALDRAGRRTADYILANRIPQAAQWMLRRLPAAWAGRLLLRAISQHAWTFAGSGSFSYLIGQPTVLQLADCPACLEVYGPQEPCTYYAATLEGLFAALVHPGARVRDQLTEQDPGTDSAGRTRCFTLDWY